MASSSSHRGGTSYGAAAYRSRDGLSTRAVSNSDEIQLRIDPMHADLDEEITGLHRKISLLKNNSRDEAIKQKDLLNSEVIVLRMELHQVKADRDRQLVELQHLTTELAKYKEFTWKSTAELDKLTMKSNALEGTCSTQNEKIQDLQDELNVANEKLKVSFTGEEEAEKHGAFLANKKAQEIGRSSKEKKKQRLDDCFTNGIL